MRLAELSSGMVRARGNAMGVGENAAGSTDVRRRGCPLAGVQELITLPEFGFWRWASWALLVTALLVGSFIACGGGQSLEFQAEKPISRVIPAAETEMLDLRFRTGSIRINPCDTDEIKVEGKVYVSTTDQATAKLKSEEVDIQATPPGKVTILDLPESTDGIEYEIELDIAVPRDIDLRVVLGSGDVETNLELPNRTDVQLGSGGIKVNLPKDFSAQINAKSNMGDVTVEGFETKTGEVRRQLIYSEFNGAVGTEWLGGKKVELSVNSGSILIQGDEGVGY